MKELRGLAAARRVIGTEQTHASSAKGSNAGLKSTKGKHGGGSFSAAAFRCYWVQRGGKTGPGDDLNSIRLVASHVKVCMKRA